MDKGFGQTLTALYDAAIDSQRWDEALDRVRVTVGARSGALHSVDFEPDTPYSVDVRSGSLRDLSDDATAHYLKEYGDYDKQAWQRLQSQPVRTAFTDAYGYGDITSIRSRGDIAWLESQCGIFRRIGARLNDNAAWMDGIVLHFSQEYEQIPDGALARLDPLLPHIARPSRSAEPTVACSNSTTPCCLCWTDCASVRVWSCNRDTCSR